MTQRKRKGRMLLLAGVLLLGIGLIWGFQGYYSEETPYVFALIFGGGAASVAGGRRFARSRPPKNRD